MGKNAAKSVTAPTMDSVIRTMENACAKKDIKAVDVMKFVRLIILGKTVKKYVCANTMEPVIIYLAFVIAKPASMGLCKFNFYYMKK